MKNTSKTIRERYGNDYYQKLGKLGGETHSGKKSAKTLMEKYGDDYFVRIRRRQQELRMTPLDKIKRFIKMVK